MQNLYKFKFGFLYETKYTDLYLEYKMAKLGLNQKEIVKETKIPQATFTRAKKIGYKNKDWVYEILLKYLNIKEASLTVLARLEEIASDLYTYVYYCQQEPQEEIYQELMTLMPEVENTNLEVIAYALLSITINQELFPKSLDKLNENKELIEAYLETVPYDIKFLLNYSLYEYSLHLNDINLTLKYGQELFNISRNLPMELEVFNDFLIMDTCFYTRDTTKGINLANKVLELQNYYFSWQIRTSTIYHLFAFYTINRNYEKLVEIARGEIISLQFDKKHQLYYFSFMTGYATSLIMLGDFNTAKEIIKTIKEYDFNKIPNKQYIPKLKDKVNVLNVVLLFVYYKEKDDYNYEIIKSEIKKEEKLEKIINMIEVLKNGGKVQKKKMRALLLEDEYTKPLIGVTDVFYLIKDEYNKLD